MASKKPVGWPREPARHGASARGIKTRLKAHGLPQVIRSLDEGDLDGAITTILQEVDDIEFLEPGEDPIAAEHARELRAVAFDIEKLGPLSKKELSHVFLLPHKDIQKLTPDEIYERYQAYFAKR